jgi:hypothetical protein
MVLVSVSALDNTAAFAPRRVSVVLLAGARDTIVKPTSRSSEASSAVDTLLPGRADADDDDDVTNKLVVMVVVMVLSIDVVAGALRSIACVRGVIDWLHDVHVCTRVTYVHRLQHASTELRAR